MSKLQMKSYKALFEMYGETSELVDEYVSELIRGSVTFHEYNSAKIANRYLVKKYGVVTKDGEGVIERLTRIYNSKFDVTDDILEIKLENMEMESIDWLWGLNLYNLESLQLSGNFIKDITPLLHLKAPSLVLIGLGQNDLSPESLIPFLRNVRSLYPNLTKLAFPSSIIRHYLNHPSSFLFVES